MHIYLYIYINLKKYMSNISVASMEFFLDLELSNNYVEENV
jgi:hypothetical protein